jgi:hypothetical protein
LINVKLSFLYLFFITTICSASDFEDVYYIQKIDFEINGKTTIFALTLASGISEGKEFSDIASLEDYVAQKKQLLLNQRELSAAEINYVINERDVDGRIPVNVTVITEDTNNFLILPYPKYSSANGLMLDMRVRDYNFLGTMTELRVNMGWTNNEKNQNALNARLGFGFPFMAAGLLWDFDFDNDFSLRLDDIDAPFYYKNDSWIAAAFPIYRTTLRLGIAQKIVLDEINHYEYDSEYLPFYYLQPAVFDKDNYLFSQDYGASSFFAEWKIPTGINVGGFGELTWLPRAEGGINYNTKGDFSYYKKGAEITLTHKLIFSKIDWIENFRRGLSLTIGNNYIASLDNFEKNKYDSYMNVLGFFPIKGVFGINFRLAARGAFSDTFHYINAGNMLRGINDSDISTTSMLSINLDFPFKVFVFNFSEIFKKEKLHVIDAELHISPIFDFALVQDIVYSYDFEYYYSGGLEIIVFPLSFRSIYLRASAALDFARAVHGRAVHDGNYEIFIGFGHHY